MQTMIKIHSTRTPMIWLNYLHWELVTLQKGEGVSRDERTPPSDQEIKPWKFRNPEKVRDDPLLQEGKKKTEPSNSVKENDDEGKRERGKNIRKQENDSSTLPLLDVFDGFSSPNIVVRVGKQTSPHS